MNIMGFLRGYMSKNLDIYDFLDKVLDILSKEFEIGYSFKEENNNFLISLGEYNFEISKDEARSYQEKGAFALDKYVLNILKGKGFTYDVNRSQYIEYCSGIYKNCKVEKINQ